MALVVADIPRFSVEKGHDLDAFIYLYIGYLNTIGINPNDVAGNPTGRSRAIGVLRSCLEGSVAEWFDENITGKNWKLKNILLSGNFTLANLVAFTVNQGAGGGACPANTFVPGSAAAIFSADPANVAVTIGASMVPSHDMMGHDAEWERAGAEPTSDPVNIAIAGNNRPVVLNGIRAHQAVSYMRTHLPSIINEKRQTELHRLVQGSDPIRVYWKKIERIGRLLKLPQEVINDHFYRGLSAVCSDDLDRIDPDLPVKKIVDILEKIEKRRFLNQSRHVVQNQYSNVAPVQMPPVVSQQEPAELRKVKAIDQEQIDKIINTQTDKITKGFQDQIQAFQTQIQGLQNIISQQSAQQHKVGQRVQEQYAQPPKGGGRRAHEFYESFNPFDDDYDRQYTMDEIMGAEPDRKTMEIARTLAKASARAKQMKMERKVDKLANAMGGLNIDSDDDSMDVDQVRVGNTKVNLDDLNEYLTNLARSSKKK